MITYKLTPTTLVNYPQAEGQTDVVFRIVWNYSGSDGDITASFCGQTDVTYTSGSPYTPYADLTEEQVIGWVLGSWSPEETASNQDQIEQQINNQKNPPTQVLPLPWKNNSVENINI